jgi:outer membrane receptor protein involved in Fe transport
VEAYRGPQSAAFGRSTFAGAINYVTADAAEQFELK